MAVVNYRLYNVTRTSPTKRKWKRHNTHRAATWQKTATAHATAAAKQSASSSSSGRRLGSSSMRPRVVHGDGFTCSDDGDVARMVTTGATSRWSRRGHPARQRRRRRTARRSWSASDYGVGSPVDRCNWPRVVGSAVDTATSVPVEELSQTCRLITRTDIRSQSRLT